MVRRILWSPEAEQDLHAIHEYIRSVGAPENATRFVIQLKEAGDSLGRLSERGRIVPNWEDPAFREIFVKQYRIVYFIGGDHIRIMRIIHGARDFDKAWGETL